MFEINVTVNAPELAEALNNLAAALKGAKLEPAASKTGKADKTAPVPPADYMPPADTAPAPAAPAPAVTPAPAGAALIDAGKINELMGLLKSFGVQAVTQLKQDQLGAFATELRKLGAQI